MDRCIIWNITCNADELFFLPNTISFLDSHSDQYVAAAPSRTNGFSSFSIPHSQFPNILGMQWGWESPDAAYIMDHTARAKRHSKKRCLIVSFLWPMSYILLPCQLCFAKLSFVKTTPLHNNHIKILSFKGAFSFHRFLFKLGTSLWTIAR